MSETVALCGDWRWCVVAASLLAGCKKEAAPALEVTVQAEHPEQGAIAEQITADAMLAPLAQAAIAPKIRRRSRSFYVQRGAQVKAGQLLATLENSDLAAAALDNKGSYHGGAGGLRYSDEGAGAGRYAEGRSSIWRRPRRIST